MEIYQVTNFLFYFPSSTKTPNVNPNPQMEERPRIFDEDGNELSSISSDSSTESLLSEDDVIPIENPNPIPSVPSTSTAESTSLIVEEPLSKAEKHVDIRHQPIEQIIEDGLMISDELADTNNIEYLKTRTRRRLKETVELKIKDIPKLEDDKARELIVMND